MDIKKTSSFSEKVIGWIFIAASASLLLVNEDPWNEILVLVFISLLGWMFIRATFLLSQMNEKLLNMTGDNGDQDN